MQIKRHAALFLRYGLVIIVSVLIALIGAELMVRAMGLADPWQPAKPSYEGIGQTIQPVAQPTMEVDRRGYWVAREGTAGVTHEGLRIVERPDSERGAAEQRPVVLLLGADLVWGNSDDPQATAAGMLNASGYIAHNLATPKAPHSQWPLLLNAYLERLHGEAVLVVVDVAQDFEAPVPITPQQAPYYETNAGFLRAIDHHGNRMTFTEAVAYLERGRRGPRPWLQTFAPFSALAQALVERLSFSGMSNWDVGALVESLELAHISAEKHGAEFLVALVGNAPNDRFAAAQNERAQRVLATFSPAYMERASSDDSVNTAAFQAQLARWFTSLLEHRAIAPSELQENDVMPTITELPEP